MSLSLTAENAGHYNLTSRERWALQQVIVSLSLTAEYCWALQQTQESLGDSCCSDVLCRLERDSNGRERWALQLESLSNGRERWALQHESLSITSAQRTQRTLGTIT